MAYSDFDKIEAFNLYFFSISSIDDPNETLPNIYYIVMILYAILQFMNKKF